MTEKKGMKKEKEKHFNKITVVKLNCQVSLETSEPLKEAIKVFDELMKKHSHNK